MKRFQIHWSDEARTNLAGIIDFIRRDSPRRARDFGRRVVRSVGRLILFPESGRFVPELEDQTPKPREILVAGYRVLYRVRSHEVEIVSVVHARRLVRPHLH